MRSTFLYIVLLTSFLSVNARTISGIVLAESDSSVIAGAECRLMSGKDVILAQTSDAEGRFSFETDVKSRLNLELSFTGYTATEILIESGSKNIALGPVYLNEAQTLSGVTVTAGSVTESKGRTIVLPSSAEIKASSTSISLFQKLPLAGVEANPINRTITVDGGTPMLLINGVPSTIEDFNALQPKDIERIEYSRMTPARYADRGTTGLISIILKKRNDGGSVYAWGRSAVNTAFVVDGNVRASYHQGPSQFTLSYNPSWRNYKKVYDNTVESYIGKDFRVNLEEHDRNPFNYFYQNIRAKYDYSPDAKTLFSATFSAAPRHRSTRAFAHTLDSELGEYDNHNRSKSNDFAPSLDLFFRKDFNDKNSLELQVVGTLSSNDYRRDNQYFYSDGSEESYIMNVDSRRRSLISEISYIHNFSDKTSLSGGYQNTVSHSTNTYLSSDYKPVLTENNNYVYVRLGQQVGKVYLSLSTGAKLFWIENDKNKRNFVRNLSTVQAAWDISNRWRLSAAFRYTPSIPSLSSLTDYMQQTSPYLVSNGNPDLKVAENFTYQLTPSFRYKKFNASLLCDYTNVNNFVMSDVMYMGNRLFLSHTVNARKSWNAGANMRMRLTDIAGFGINVSVGVRHYETMGDNWTHALTSWNTNFTIWWNKGPYTITYWRQVPGKYLNGHSIDKDENGDALQFGYKPDKHWTFDVSWMFMFDVKGTKYPSLNYSQVNPSVRERYIKDNGNMVMLSVSYSADFGSIFRSVRRSLNNSDDASSLLKM